MNRVHEWTRGSPGGDACDILGQLHPLLVVLPLVTYPIAIVTYTRVGAIWGARALMLLAFPFPIMATHAAVAWLYGADALETWAAGALSSLFTVFTWSFAYGGLCSLVRERLPARYQSWEAWLCLGASIVVATLGRVLYEPLREGLVHRPIVLSIAAVSMTMLAHFVHRLRQNERSPLLAPASHRNLLGRIVTVVAILYASAHPDLIGAWGSYVIGSFPRLTVEMSVSTHVAHGATAARQVLSGLPIGLGAALLWCLSLLWLSKLGVGHAMAIGGLLATAWTGGCYVANRRGVA